jgi:DNA-binding transcriptional ArsR family regulator
MKEIEPIESLERASALLHPLRVRLLGLAAEPVSAVELARDLGETPQKINYHLRELEKAGLLKRVREEKVRNLTKAYFQAQAKSLWFSPKLVSERGAEARIARDQVSLHNLLGLSRQLERDVIRLLNSSQSEGAAAASLGVTADLAFPNGEARRGFMEAYVATLDDLIHRFGARPGSPVEERYTALLAVYPATRRAAASRGGKSSRLAPPKPDQTSKGPSRSTRRPSS